MPAIGIVANSSPEPGSNPPQPEGIGLDVEVMSDTPPEPRDTGVKGAFSRVTDAFRRESTSDTPKRRGRPAGSKNKPKGDKPTGTLQPSTVVDWITTLHNVPSALLELEALHIEEETVQPYATSIANWLNAHIPEVADKAQTNVSVLGLIAYLGVVEGPTLINTAKEARLKLHQKKEAQAGYTPVGTVPPARPVPMPAVEPVNADNASREWARAVEGNGHTTQGFSQIDALDRLGRQGAETNG